MDKISAILSSSAAVDALEAAIRSLPGGQDALDSAISSVTSEQV